MAHFVNPRGEELKGIKNQSTEGQLPQKERGDKGEDDAALAVGGGRAKRSSRPWLIIRARDQQGHPRSIGLDRFVLSGLRGGGHGQTAATSYLFQLVSTGCVWPRAFVRR